jgi:hypothetical protein
LRLRLRLESARARYISMVGEFAEQVKRI